MLTKTVTVLDEYDIGEYRSLDDDGHWDGRYILELDDDMWRELGNPEKLTITIEPGDMLNSCPICKGSLIQWNPLVDGNVVPCSCQICPKCKYGIGNIHKNCFLR